MVESECGTYAGWHAHRRNGTDPCADCRRAAASYQTEYRQRPDAAAADRRRSIARGRALTRLAREYPVTYREFYQQELRRGPVNMGDGLSESNKPS